MSWTRWLRPRAGSPDQHGGWGRIAAVLGLLAGLLVPGSSAAQDSTQVRLLVSLSPDSTTHGGRTPLVRTQNLLGDPRWISMLRSGFPIRLHYRVEVWRSREGWFDSFERQEEWDVIVRHEPLLDQYTVTRIYRQGRLENRYATLDALSAALAVQYRVAVTPTAEGVYYYAATLRVTALSDSDMAEFERFLQGDLKTGARNGDVGSAVGRGAKRLVLKIAGLPSQQLEERSGTFAISGKR